MDLTELLYREYCENLTSDTKEFDKAWDYFIKGVKSSEEFDYVAELLSEAVWAEGRRAFAAGISAVINFLTGGRCND